MMRSSRHNKQMRIWKYAECSDELREGCHTVIQLSYHKISLVRKKKTKQRINLLDCPNKGCLIRKAHKEEPRRRYSVESQRGNFTER